MLKGNPPTSLLIRLRDTLAEAHEGQDRLDKVVALIADSMAAEVCSIYLARADRSFELCASFGLSAKAVHQTIMAAGEGLVGRVVRDARPLNTSDAPNTRGYSFRPETGEEVFHGFCGVPIQRLGKVMGVLVVQSVDRRFFSSTEVSTLEFIAIVLAEMAELGAFVADIGGAMAGMHREQAVFPCVVAQEGMVIGNVVLHNPQIQVEKPVADDPAQEQKRLEDAFATLDGELSSLAPPGERLDDETSEIISVVESFSKDKGFRRRLISDVESGLSAEAAVEIEQSRIRSRMHQINDPYIRERMSDIDDLAHRLLRILAGVKRLSRDELPENAVLVARNIGPAELLEYGRAISGVVLSEGSVGSHAAIIARAWAIPLVVQAQGIAFEAREGNAIIIDGDQGQVYLRPDENIASALRDKVEMGQKAQAQYLELVDKPALSLDGQEISLFMNAGLLYDLPSLAPSGAAGVGLFRTELQFLAQNNVPRRDELSHLYSRVLNAAGDKPVIFRTLDVGSDKVLPYIDRIEEPNPALGWRAIRVGLDRKAILVMQLHGLFRAAAGRDLHIMFPFIAQREEFDRARNIVLETLTLHKKFGYDEPRNMRIGAMLETPSLGFAPDAFFESVDFLSVGGNDLKQFFFAADRENERVRRRYDSLNTSYLQFLRMIAERAHKHETELSFCGEDAGRPLEALAFAAMGFRRLSMRAASIGAVKHVVRQIDLGALRGAMEAAMEAGAQSVRGAMVEYLRANNVDYSAPRAILEKGLEKGKQ